MNPFKASAIMTCALFATITADAKPPRFSTIYDFPVSQEGNNPAPSGTLSIDSTGAIYGTTIGGGLNGCMYGCGTIYRYQPATANFTTLYSFSGQSDGDSPATGLIFGHDGQLYGMTQEGGEQSCEDGCGTLFRIDPSTGNLATLFSFNASIGANPLSPLAIDKKGVLYGSTPEYGTVAGGDGGYGSIFSYDPTTNSFTTLYTFGSLPDGADGEEPYGVLTLDKTGLVYGETIGGGANGYGTIFVLNPVTKTLKTLYSFNSTAGKGFGGLVIDKAGMLYGTTYGSGMFDCTANCGTIFRVDPKTDTFTTLHIFNGTDGNEPSYGLSLSKAGLLYGSTTAGGAHCYGGCGTLFRYDTEKQKFTSLLSLTGLDYSAANPESPLTFDATGSLYGTAGGGLSCPYNGCGTIFKLSP